MNELLNPGHKNQSVLDLIDAALAEQGCTTENALALKIGMNRQDLSRFRLGTKPSNSKLRTLCEAAKRDFTKTLADIEAEYAEDETEKKKWLRLSKSIGGFAASFMLIVFALVTFIVTTPVVQAKESMTYATSIPRNTNYAFIWGENQGCGFSCSESAGLLWTARLPMIVAVGVGSCPTIDWWKFTARGRSPDFRISPSDRSQAT